MLRSLYHWILKWAQTPYGIWALVILAFCESSFFPVPPDVLLIAMAIASPARSFFYALLCSVGSVAGGCLGYFIGWKFMAEIGTRIISLYGLADKFDYIQALYMKYDAWAIGIAGFTPIPYKVFTISAGAFDIDFPVFAVASTVSRSARFFLIGALIYVFGARIQTFIDKYFNMLAVGVTVLIVAGFAVIKYML